MTSDSVQLCLSLCSIAPPLPGPPDQSHLDALLAEPAMTWLARVLLVCLSVALLVAVAYVVASFVARMLDGHWLRRVGPLEISDPAAGRLSHESGASMGSTHHSDDEVTELRVRLAITSELLEKIQHERTR